MNDVLISVIVPIYKVESYLARCVNSILCQTYQNLEVILVDDGSPDRCGAICDTYAKQDERIKVIHKANGGLSSARNAGIDAAAGEYLAFVDSDDWIDADMVETLYEIAELHNADIADCSLRYVLEDGTVLRTETRNTGEITVCTPVEALRAELQWTMFRPTPVTKLYHNSIFMDGKRYPEGVFHEDEFFTHHALYAARKLVYIDLAKYNYYQGRSGSITQTFTEKNLDCWLAYRERLHFFQQNVPELLDEMRSYYLWLSLDRIYKCYEFGIKGKRVAEIIETLKRESSDMMKWRVPHNYKLELSVLCSSYKLFILFKKSTRWKKWITNYKHLVKNWPAEE